MANTYWPAKLSIGWNAIPQTNLTSDPTFGAQAKKRFSYSYKWGK